MLDLSAITLDTRLQCRAAIKKATVAGYAERMKAGDKFPPLDVFEVDGTLLLVDGWQRCPAAQQAGLTEFPAVAHQGTRLDAIRFAVRANAAHGQPRTNRDKRRAVELALRELPDQSDGAVAVLCKVSQPFVSSVRRQLKTVLSCGKRTGRDGKARKPPQRRTSDKERPKSGPTEEATDKAGHGNQQTDQGARARSAATGRETPSTSAGRRADTFSSDEALNRVEAFLFAELELWPEEKRRKLGNELRKFADINCC